LSREIGSSKPNARIAASLARAVKPERE